MNASKRLPLNLLKHISSPSTSKCRNIHTTSICLAKYSRPSKPARQRVPRPGTPSLDAESSLPPSVMLAAAQKSGVIQLAPEAVVNFLEDFIECERKRLGEWEKDVCEKHKITPQTLTLLAGILRRSPTPSQHLLATKLMLSASHLGSKEATYELILTYLSHAPKPSPSQKTPNTSNPTKPTPTLHPTPQKALAKLIKASDPSALALQGKLLHHQGKTLEALDFLTRAMEGSSTSPDDLGFDGIGDALVEKGMIHLKLRESASKIPVPSPSSPSTTAPPSSAETHLALAKTAFQKAALDHDEPLAYYYLARWEARGSTQENVYLIKAASSGVLEAIVRVAESELEKVIGDLFNSSTQPDMIEVENVKSLPTTLHDYGIALEWLHLAAEKDDHTCILHLGCIYKSLGQIEEWSNYFEKLVGLRYGLDGQGDKVGHSQRYSARTLEVANVWSARGVEFWG